MRTKPLTYIYGLYLSRSQTLVGRLTTKLPTNPVEARECKPVHHDGFAFQMIRIQHLWGEFCRELVVRSAMGGCTTRTGNQLSRVPHVSRVSDLPKVTKLAFAGRGSNWEEPKFALKQAAILSVSNYLDVNLGIGSASTVLADLKVVRNFLTHPNQVTAKIYDQLARENGFRGLSPDQFLQQLTPGGATIFEAWSQNLIVAAWNAVA